MDELVRRYGMERVSAFLERLGQTGSVEQAYEQAFAPARWAGADQGVFE